MADGCWSPYLMEMKSNSSTITDEVFPPLTGIAWKTNEVCSVWVSGLALTGASLLLVRKTVSLMGHQ